MEIYYIQMVHALNLLDIQLGDINGDFIVNILDIIVIVDMIVTGNIENISIADFNQDGAVNILDIVSIVNFILDS